MQYLTLRLKTSSEFLDRYLPDGPAGGFFVPERRGLDEGARVYLELGLEWLEEKHYAWGVVERAGITWENCGRQERGVVVRLEPREADVRARLVEKVRQSAEAAQSRRHARLPTRLEVHYFGVRTPPRDGEVLNLSESGVFVRTPRPLPAGTQVHLRLEDRARRVMRHIRGRVVRLDFRGPVAGMGIELTFASRRERRMVGELCEHLRASFHAP